MAIDSIGAVPQTGSTASLRNAGLNQEDFLKILLAQLSFQDPLKPMDNQEFIAQMAQFSSLELNRQYNEKADTLLAFQSANQAVSLVGKEVEATLPNGSSFVGTVGTVLFQNGSPVLNLTHGTETAQVGLSSVFRVRNPIVP